MAPAPAPPVTGPSTPPDTPREEPSAQPTPRGTLKVSTRGWETDFEITSVNLAEFDSGGPGKDGIPSIDTPEFESAADSRRWQEANAPVISLVVNDQARAYPLAILMWHEIVNDTIDGVPVVVTFCPLCNTALVFERELGGVEYDFGTTGNLRFSDLVMYDRQTESWWQQATGEAIVGELTGSRLRFIPAQIVALEDFSAAYPDGEVLSRETGHQREYGQNPYVGYDSVDQNPFLFRGVVDDRLAPMERVVAVTLDGEAVAYPYPELEKARVVNDELGGQQIVVLWEPGTASALDDAWINYSRDIGATGVFAPRVGEQRLTFSVSDDGRVIDEETGSTWAVTGLATDGALAGESLEPIAHGDHFWFSWAVFEPDTRIWTADQ